MTVKANVDSTLNTQSVELVILEKSPNGDVSYGRQSLSGGSEELIFNSLDGGADKEYKVKVVPSTNDASQTATVDYGAEVRIDPVPHRDVGTDNSVRETANFQNGVGAKELGLGEHTLVGGLLTTALNDGEVLADDGYVYSTVQAAQDAASSWIFVGPGTFSEGVTFDTPGLTVVGGGYDSHINSPDDTTAVSISAANVSISNISITAGGGGSNGYGITTASGGDNISISDVVVRSAEALGISFEHGNDHIVEQSEVNSTGSIGCRSVVDRTVFDSVTIDSPNSDILRIEGVDDCIISNCIGTNGGSQGIFLRNDADDNIVIGCRVHNTTNDGIRVQGTTPNNNIIANNRVSGSGGSDINDSGTGTVLDANNTGAAN